MKVRAASGLDLQKSTVFTNFFAHPAKDYMWLDFCPERGGVSQV